MRSMSFAPRISDFCGMESSTVAGDMQHQIHEGISYTGSKQAKLPKQIFFKSEFSIGNISSKGPCSIAMLVYQSVYKKMYIKKNSENWTQILPFKISHASVS